MSIHKKEPLFPNAPIKRWMSLHSIITYIATFIAVGIMLYIGIRHFNDVDEYGRTWGRFALMHVAFGFLGHISFRLVSGQPFVLDPMKLRSIPKEERKNVGFLTKIFHPINVKTFIWGIIVVALIMLIQFLTNFIQYEITATEEALYYIFSSVTEEVFYRGLLCYAVLYAIFREEIYNNRNIPAMITKGFTAIVSGVIFGISHARYYGSNVLYAVIIGGCILGLVFVYFTKFDLTAMIMGHVLVNIFATGTWLIQL